MGAKPLPVHALDASTTAVYAVVFSLMLLLGARRPSLGVAGLITLDPFSLYRTIGTIMISLPKTALIGMLLGLLLRRPSLRILIAKEVRPLLVGAALILCATILSITQAAHLAEALRETLKALEYLTVFVTVVLAMRDDPNERCIRIALAGTVATVSLLACAQLLSGAPSALLYGHHPVARIAGPIEGPNQLSGYLGVTLPLITAFTLLRKPLYGELAVLGTGTITLILTFSRAGITTTLAAIAAIIMLAPATPRRSVALIVCAATGIGTGIVALLGYIAAHDFGILWRFASTNESEDPGSVGKRSQLWHAAIVLWKRHPWLGIGAGNFELEISQVGPQGIKTHANSLYLQSLVEGGLPLLAAQMYTVATSIGVFVQAYAREPLALGALAASAGLALHQVVDLLVFYPKVGSMWWIILGLGVTAGGRKENPCRILDTACCAV